MVENPIYVVVDTKDSDKGPETVILGCSMALEKYPNLVIAIVGDEKLIKDKIVELHMDKERVEIIDAPDVISNFDNPVEAIYKKDQSSLVKALKLVGEEKYTGLVTAGNSGAILMGSFKFLSTPDRQRPCMAATLPNENGGLTCLVDCGATVDCTKGELLQFAKNGSNFMRNLYQIESPKVALLSNGAEETKGNKLVKETHQALKEQQDINFIGNIEPNRFLSGDADVVVTDGFSGNMALKSIEGMAKRIITDIVKLSKKTNNPELMNVVGYLMSLYDFGSLGGGVILGARKPIIKARGNSDEKAIVSTCGMLVNFANGRALLERK